MFQLMFFSHCSCYPTDPVFLLVLCSYCSFIPNDHMFSYSTDLMFLLTFVPNVSVVLLLFCVPINPLLILTPSSKIPNSY